MHEDHKNNNITEMSYSIITIEYTRYTDRVTDYEIHGKRRNDQQILML